MSAGPLSHACIKKAKNRERKSVRGFFIAVRLFYFVFSIFAAVFFY